MREIGQIALEAGFYRCAICGAEIYIEARELFPSCAGKDHSPRWIFVQESAVLVAGSAL